MSALELVHGGPTNAAEPVNGVNGTPAPGLPMITARVLGTEFDGTIAVAYGDGWALTARCDQLETSTGEPCPLATGDAVLALLPGSVQGRGVIVGRIGKGRTGSVRKAEAPDEVILEAKKGLTLKCGEGSITIREDGKILIKGKDLVSHATRTNRIKGGSVQIN